MTILIHQATIINEGRSFIGSVLIHNDKIEKIFSEKVSEETRNRCTQIIDAKGLYLLPGVIDDQVHFRDPGLPHKADIFTESCAAVAGGVTSYMDMPNTKPQTITIDDWHRKNELASTKSLANYAFYLGATNENIDELKKADSKLVCGIKVFMGASTGNMLVDNHRALQQIFAEIDIPVATHCEKEEIIRANIVKYKNKFGDFIPIKYHPAIRSAEACYRSSAQAVELADKYGTRLHILHLSTAREMALFDTKPIEEKKITAEVCVPHLIFCSDDYARLGTRIKWNPAVKTAADRDALRKALKKGKLDVIATDHAPHLLSEKEGGCLQAASGGPVVQHSLQIMMELAKQGVYTKEFVVEKMCHAPAKLFNVKQRGFIREDYYADLVLLNPNTSYTVSKDNILYKCGWSPFENETFTNSVERTFINGKSVFENGKVNKEIRGVQLQFLR